MVCGWNLLALIVYFCNKSVFSEFLWAVSSWASAGSIWAASQMFRDRTVPASHDLRNTRWSERNPAPWERETDWKRWGSSELSEGPVFAGSRHTHVFLSGCWDSDASWSFNVRFGFRLNHALGSITAAQTYIKAVNGKPAAVLEAQELFGKWMRCQSLSRNWRAIRQKCVLANSPQRHGRKESSDVT